MIEPKPFVMNENSRVTTPKYFLLRVGNLIETKKSYHLRAIYFQEEYRTFTDEILQEIGITEDYRIDKPGTNKSMGRRLEKFILENRPELTKDWNPRINQITDDKISSSSV